MKIKILSHKTNYKSIQLDKRRTADLPVYILDMFVRIIKIYISVVKNTTWAMSYY